MRIALRHQRTPERGFTLIELLVVIIIIGILASIAIPVYLNQRQKAAYASVVSDVKSAAIVMEDTVADGGKYSANIPNYNKVSPQSRVVTNIQRSGPNRFCLVGTHATIPSIRVNYDSSTGGVLPAGTSCAAQTGQQTFSQTLTNARVALIHQRSTAMRNALTNAGINNVTVLDETITVDQARQYDVVIASALDWNIPPAVGAKLVELQAAGINVLSDGNDTFREIPLITNVAYLRNSTASYDPTGNPVSPTFPYIFSETPWTTDNWNCPTTIRSSSVAVGEYTRPDGSGKCITMIADVNNGRWFHMARVINGSTFQSGLLWVLGS